MKKILLTFLMLQGILLQAQTTFDRVYQILQTNCTQSCHKAGNASGNLLLDGSKQDVMNNLVNVSPANTAAAAKGFKRVFPGDARKSFLFHKVNQGLDINVALEVVEGAPMPLYQNALSKTEREMIRQWIIFGAKDSLYTFADETVINDYYNGKGEKRDEIIPIPQNNEGFQVYFGPIFLKPGVEVEFDSKFPLFNNIDMEVYKMNLAMNKESHHMAIYKYKPGKDTLTAPGLKKVNSIADAAGLFFDAEVIAQWPNSLELELPQGTALFWDSSTVLNLSYHILNYSDSIIAAEAYLNVTTRPRTNNTIEMKSYPVRYDGHAQYRGGWDVFNLVIMPTNTDTTFTINQWHQDSTFYWNLWSIQAHTHKIGKDFNIFLRDSSGAKATQIYNGTYNDNHTFDQGFYDWEHPPLRYFDPPLSVDMRKGLIHEAVFRNDTGDTVNFGLKTTDEMFVSYMFYYKTSEPLPNSVKEQYFKDLYVNTYPNPFADKINFFINTTDKLDKATLKVFNLLGEEVLVKNSLETNRFSLDFSNTPKGYYFYSLFNEGKVIATGKILSE